LIILVFSPLDRLIRRAVELDLAGAIPPSLADEVMANRVACNSVSWSAGRR